MHFPWLRHYGHFCGSQVDQQRASEIAKLCPRLSEIPIAASMQCCRVPSFDQSPQACGACQPASQRARGSSMSSRRAPARQAMAARNTVHISKASVEGVCHINQAAPYASVLDLRASQMSACLVASAAPARTSTMTAPRVSKHADKLETCRVSKHVYGNPRIKTCPPRS